MAKQQRIMRVEQRSPLSAMQHLESRPPAELAAETRFKPAAQDILGPPPAERSVAKAPRTDSHHEMPAARARPPLQSYRHTAAPHDIP